MSQIPSSDKADRPLRVLHIAAGNLFGGVETLLVTFAKARANYPSLASEFALCFDGRLSKEIKDSGSALHALGAVRFSRPWTTWLARRRFKRLLKERGFDVVVAHGCWAHLLVAETAKKCAVTNVFWMHDMIGKGKPNWVDRVASKILPDYVFANSHATAQTLPNLFPNVESKVIRTPVEPPAPFDRPLNQQSLRKEFETEPTDVVIVLGARLERWKGHVFLLDALGQLKEKPGWTAWLAGGAQRPHEASYLDELKAQADRLGITERLRFIGQRSDMSRVLGAADIHCQPNLGPEPFGIAYVEALYAGLPVVSSQLGGALEIVNEACGRLVPAGDVGALARTLAELIDNSALRAELGKAGPSRALEICGLPNVLPEIERYLRDAVATPS